MGPGVDASALSQALGGRPSLFAGASAAAVAALAGAGWLSPAGAAASAVLGGLMAAISAADARHYRVPDPLVLLSALAGFLWLWTAAAGAKPLGAIGMAGLHMLLCGGAFLLVREAFYRLNGVDGIGLGDVKLAAVGGIWLGWELFAIAVLLSSVGALGFVAARTAIEGAWPRSRRIPFALYLAPAIWITWFLGQAMR